MQTSIPNKRTWIWLIAFLLLFLFVSFFILSKQPKTYPTYVFNSPSPTGVKALFTYLENENDVKSWSHPPVSLPKSTKNQMLVMVEPYFVPEKEEMKGYQDFMEAGNTILLFKKNPKGLFDLKTAPIETDPFLNEGMTVHNQNSQAFHAEISSAIRLQTINKDEILLEDKLGPIALRRPYGNGQLIVAISPEWMTNDKLLIHDHISLVLSLLQEGNSQTFLFDEYTHVRKNASTMTTLYPKWFLLILLQGILYTVLWIWYRGKRFGPLFVPREETVRFSDEGMIALTAWYLRGRRYHDSLMIQADYLKVLLQERWGVPYSKEWKDLSVHFERQKVQMPLTEINSFLNGLTDITAKEKISKQEYLFWSKKLDGIRKEVE